MIVNKKNWLRLNDKDNALDYLEQCAYFVQQKGKKKWKWVIITLRQGLYNAFILSLAGTNSDTVLKSNAKGNKSPRKLIDFPEALNRIKIKFQSASIITDIAYKDCVWLNNELRNNFEHFTPNKSWAINLGDMPRVINSTTRIIHFLLLQSGCMYFSSYKTRKLKHWLRTIKNNKDNFN